MFISAKRSVVSAKRAYESQKRAYEPQKRTYEPYKRREKREKRVYKRKWNSGEVRNNTYIFSHTSQPGLQARQDDAVLERERKAQNHCLFSTSHF